MVSCGQMMIESLHLLARNFHKIVCKSDFECYEQFLELVCILNDYLMHNNYVDDFSFIWGMIYGGVGWNWMRSASIDTPSWRDGKHALLLSYIRVCIVCLRERVTVCTCGEQI